MRKVKSRQDSASELGPGDVLWGMNARKLILTTSPWKNGWSFALSAGDGHVWFQKDGFASREAAVAAGEEERSYQIRSHSISAEAIAADERKSERRRGKR